jgi:peptidoglycan/LPS O-acetylase OafA/YrhL
MEQAVLTSEPRAIPRPVQESRLPYLDAIRGIAVFWVFLDHFLPDITEANPLVRVAFRVGRAGWIGVDLFFVLSGFLITGILLRNRTAPRYFRNFYLRRALRIFPLYYTVLFIGLVLLPMIFPHNVDLQVLRQKQYWLWFYGSNILMGFRGDQAFSTETFSLSHTWSLAVEEHFYLMWPLVVFVFSTSSLKRFCWTLFLFSFLCRAVTLFAGGTFLSAAVPTPCRVDSLALGALVALSLQENKLQAFGRLLAILTGVLGTMLIGIYLLPASIPWRRPLVLALCFSVWGSLFAFGICVVSSDKPSSLRELLASNRPLIFFGKYSYAAYVLHQILNPYYARFFPPDYFIRVMGSQTLGALAYAVICITLSMGAALLSWHGLEKHFLKLKEFFPSIPAVSTKVAREMQAP